MIYLISETRCTAQHMPLNGDLHPALALYVVQVVQYRCDTGFVLTGVEMSFCQAIGTWSSPAPLCQDINGETIVQQIIVRKLYFSKLETLRVVQRPDVTVNQFFISLDILWKCHSNTFYQRRIREFHQVHSSASIFLRQWFVQVVYVDLSLPWICIASWYSGSMQGRCYKVDWGVQYAMNRLSLSFFL